MSYHYFFDRDTWGNFSLSRESYKVAQEALDLLREEIQAWNEKALQHGAITIPYEQEVADLDRMIKGGQEMLDDPNRYTITVNRISIGSLRYIKAGLTLMIARKESDILAKSKEGWPQGALFSLRGGIERIAKISVTIDIPPADILEEINVGLGRKPSSTAEEWDVFISHASEDKDEFARPLAEKLQTRGLRVWFDEFTLTVGDSLRRSIDSGLARSRFGIVVISPHFLAKEWPQRELDGLVSREIDGGKVILPIWHGVDFKEVRQFSPVLADRLATKSSRGMDHVVNELVLAIGASRRS